MKKALILTPSFLPTLNGMTYATLGHARILSTLGFETTIVSNECHEIDLINEYGLSNVKCIKFPIYGSDLIWSPVRGPVSEILDKLNTLKPDFVFVEGWYNWGIYLLIRLPKFYVKIVFSHGSADNDVYNLSSLVRRLGYFIYDSGNRSKIMKAVDGIILLSAHKDSKRFRDFQLAKNYSIPSMIIPNINVEEVFTNKLQYLPKTTTGFNIALIGEMSPNKNQAYIIDKFHQLDALINIHFFYPKENAYSLQIKKKSLSFTQRVKFHEGLDRIRINEFIKNNIDLILVLSRTEAQPIVIIDGVFQGIPFVSTNVGCMPTFEGGIVCEIDHIVNNINLICSNGLVRSRYKLNTKVDIEMLRMDTRDFESFLYKIS